MHQLQDIKDQARGRWLQILPALGISRDSLYGKNGLSVVKNAPCPACGGNDRFSFKELPNGDVNFYCRTGCNGSGVDLLIHRHGWSFKRVVDEVRQVIGGHSVDWPVYKPSPTIASTKDRTYTCNSLKKAWVGSARVQEGDAVSAYLEGRGLILPEFPKVLRRHPALRFSIKDQNDPNGKRYLSMGDYPAMLSLVQGGDGRPLSIHRTYLSQNGNEKADIHCPFTGDVLPAKKVMSEIKGGAIRLFAPENGAIAITEGVETALAVHLWTGLPVWAAISAPGMKGIVIPEEIKKVFIFADNDEPDERGRCAGQEAAKDLAARLRTEGRSVKNYLADTPGDDFLDMYLRYLEHKAAS